MGDTGLKTAVHVDGTLNDPRDTDRGWSVELAVPWVVLGEYAQRRVPPADGDQWRVNFSRVEWDVDVLDGKYRKIADRPEHNWVWSPQGVVDMHRPERWGYVQFNTESPGTAVFRPDPSLAARDSLMYIYDAQQAYRRERGHWAGTLAELALPDSPLTPAKPRLKLTPDGFEVCLEYVSDLHVVRLLHVRSDSRLWDTETNVNQGY